MSAGHLTPGLIGLRRATEALEGVANSAKRFDSNRVTSVFSIARETAGLGPSEQQSMNAFEAARDTQGSCSAIMAKMEALRAKTRGSGQVTSDPMREAREVTEELNRMVVEYLGDMGSMDRFYSFIKNLSGIMRDILRDGGIK